MAHLISETKTSSDSIQKLSVLHVDDARDSMNGKNHPFCFSVLLKASSFLSLSELSSEVLTPSSVSLCGAVVSLMIQSCSRSQSMNIAFLLILIRAERSVCVCSDHTI